MSEICSYQSGFGNEFATEALPGALPAGQNSPQRCAYGLYAEQWSGTAFTAPRAANRRSWLYRIRPAAMHGSFAPVARDPFEEARLERHMSPDQLRWDPLPLPDAATDFIDGLVQIAGNGAPDEHAGCGIYLYVANRSMQNRYFYSADGEWLIVPERGALMIETELGRLELGPQEIAVLPRGLRFRVGLLEELARGYLCENFGAHLRLPELGPIGSNGLANPRDFSTPTAWYEDRDAPGELFAKFAGRLWRAALDHSPFDVVAWHGNNAPYKYDLRRFNTLGSISYDHPDPSIFVVLQSPSETAGTSNLDFVVFPPRWLVMEHTFRPPWYHRNIASEYMGLITGRYDAKSEGFVPGGGSLHNCMSGHGPDAMSFERASSADTSQPAHLTDTMAFMFETRRVLHPTRASLEGRPPLQNDYLRCWANLPKRFDPGRA
jgi:homogentisate 1,2-dioxygenase